MHHTELIKIFGAFFAIMNPFINLPIFLAMTADFTVTQQRLLAIKITVFSFIMCAVILLSGQFIIHFFGITIDQFRIAGGIVLAHISWSMLNGNEFSSHHGTGSEKNQIQNISGLAFYPITFPMIVGPGTIATLIIYASHTRNFEQELAIGLIVSSILAILFFVLFFASSIGKLLSDTMKTITTRLMGMILLAISVDMITSGIKVVFPGLSISHS